jgi:hypothetical protein
MGLERIERKYQGLPFEQAGVADRIDQKAQYNIASSRSGITKGLQRKKALKGRIKKIDDAQQKEGHLSGQFFHCIAK